MPTFEFTSPEGKTYSVTGPEGATKEQAFGILQSQIDSASAQAEKPKRAIGDEIVRTAGLTIRPALEAAPAFADFLASPIRAIVNKGADVFGYPKAGKLENLVSSGLDKIGVAKPETPAERIVNEGTKLGYSTMMGFGPLKLAEQAKSPIMANVANQMLANPASQVVASAAGGAAGQHTAEQGGSPLGQMAASLSAALLAPAAMSAGQYGYNALSSLVNGTRTPQNIEFTLKTTLGKNGIDWDSLGNDVREQLKNDAKNAVYSGQPLDPKALARLFDFRNIGAKPMLGDITQDPKLITLQRNTTKQLANQNSLLGATDLPQIQNDNAKKVLSTLENAAQSPLDSYATGQGIIDKIAAKDAGYSKAQSALYKDAREAYGRDIPLDRTSFVNKAFDSLIKNNKTAFLPAEIKEILNDISIGQKKFNGKTYDVLFNVDSIDSLKTMLATASKSATNGNARAAISMVRDALETAETTLPIKRGYGSNLPIKSGDAARLVQEDAAAANALGLYDKARALSRERYTWQDSAKFIEDALENGSPDKFVQKHIINGTVEDLAKLKTELGNVKPISDSKALSTIVNPSEVAKNADPMELTNAVRKQLVDYIMKRGVADSDTTKFSSSGLKNGLDAIGERKLSLFFSPEEIQQLKSAVNVGRYMQSQPIGAAVNNSNSAAMIAAKGTNALAKMSGIPFLGPLVAEPLNNLGLQYQGRVLSDVSRGLAKQAPKQAGNGNLIPLSLLLASPSVEGGTDKKR